MVDGCLCFFCNKEVSPLCKLTIIENHTPTFLLFEKSIATAVSFVKIQRVCSILSTWSSLYVTVESFYLYKSIFMGSKTKNWYLGTGLFRPRAQVRYACWNRRQRQITVLFCVIKTQQKLINR